MIVHSPGLWNLDLRAPSPLTSALARLTLDDSGLVHLPSQRVQDFGRAVNEAREALSKLAKLQIQHGFLKKWHLTRTGALEATCNTAYSIPSACNFGRCQPAQSASSE